MPGVPPRTVVGIDEAGRGSWIGPLVVGAVAVASDEIGRLVDAGAQDSKRLSRARREEVYGRLEKIARCGSVAIPPAEIDRFVRHGKLNELEARAFGELARPYAPAVVRVDACDTNAPRFGRAVARAGGPGLRVSARHRADENDPVVGAASIVAKVRRDRAIEALARDLGADIGSGYPSDATTIEFVRAFAGSSRALPPWVRRSWATTGRVIGVSSGPTLDGSSP